MLLMVDTSPGECGKAADMVRQALCTYGLYILVVYRGQIQIHSLRKMPRPKCLDRHLLACLLAPADPGCCMQGDTSPQSDPMLYLQSVSSLIHWYRRYGRDPQGRWVPLVVNTHGWVKGLGFDLLADILRILAPTHVVQVLSASANKNLPAGNFWSPPGAPPSHILCVRAAGNAVDADDAKARDVLVAAAKPSGEAFARKRSH